MWNPFGGGRRAAGTPPPEPAPSAYRHLEEAPLMALVLASGPLVVRANRAARDFFEIRPERLPESLIMLTRELRLEAAIRDGAALQQEVTLAHRAAILQVTVVPGDGPEERVAYLSDLSELRRLRTVRQEFVANLSHELRTPMTSLRLAAESLGGDLPPAARAKFAARALKEADHLAAIVDNLRQLAEIESNRTTLRRSRIDIEELIAEVARRIHLERPLAVAVEPGLELHTDRAKLAQALGNLLDNAAKFSAVDSEIEIRAYSGPKEVLFTVRDHGPGIAPEHWDRVFERFYKIDPARTRDIPGSGLGLAITKHLALLMGGRVWTEAAPNGGQVFGLALRSLESIER